MKVELERVNVSVRLLFFEERQGSRQLRAGVSGRDAEKRASKAGCMLYSQERYSPGIYVNRRVGCSGLTAVVV